MAITFQNCVASSNLWFRKDMRMLGTGIIFASQELTLLPRTTCVYFSNCY